MKAVQVTIDSLCTFHVMHITTCTDVNKENLYRMLRADRQITKMIRINQALQRRHTFNYWNCIHIKIYALHFIMDWQILVTWYLSPHHPQQKELCLTDVWKLHQKSSFVWMRSTDLRQSVFYTPYPILYPAKCPIFSPLCMLHEFHHIYRCKSPRNW